MSSNQFNGAVSSLKESIFSTITQLANSKKAINLAQGFPDFDGPKWVVGLAQKALAEGKNQYAPSMGIYPLRQAIAQNYEQLYKIKYNPADEVLVCNGATEALYATILALVEPGDEVVVFEPSYDSYLAALQMARAKVKVVTLHAPHFKLDKEALRTELSEKTKLVIFNNPHNPTGRVFSAEEIKDLVELSQSYNFFLISDEVYEYLTFDRPHIPLATIEDIKDRVITISSIGKTLSLTGWKVGWACGPAEVIKVIHNAKQFICFCGAHPLQEAVAKALPQMDDYIKTFKKEYRERRDLLVGGLKNAGFTVYEPEGTYFALAEVPKGKNDVEYCKELIHEKSVATIPTSAFYVKSNEGENLIRFCFAKQIETLQAALAKLGGN